MTNIFIIGAGPAGMMAAISAKTHHPQAKVTLVDSNPLLGKKLRYTGGGRCNVTADVSNEQVILNIPKNGKFLYSSLHNFNSQDIQTFFTKNGTALKIEDHLRVFPQSDKSADIVSALEKKINNLGVICLMETCVSSIDNALQLIYFTNQNSEYFDHIILATGGKCLPSSGSNGVGYTLAQSFGHTITKLVPAEVPLVSNDEVIQNKTLQGLSFKDVTISIYNHKKVSKQITHDLLFTHFGISGPAALRSSFYVITLLEKLSVVKLEIDFLPTIKLEILQADYVRQSLPIATYLQVLGLPKRLIQYIIDQHPQHLTAPVLLAIFIMVKAFPLSVYDTRGFTQAFVTNGGIPLKEVDPRTMKSKLVTNLSFAGEILDINGFTGGYNITAALSTGFTAGKYSTGE
ncbi:MAG: aminoacetone oxidase family FAD-binding enzyme [Culicoidibacterales bacterium]